MTALCYECHNELEICLERPGEIEVGPCEHCIETERQIADAPTAEAMREIAAKRWERAEDARNAILEGYSE